MLLAAREEPPEDGGARLAVGVGLAAAAALGIGLFLAGMDAAGEADVLWALAVARAASVGPLSRAVLAHPSRARVGDAPHLPAIAAIGVLDLAANGLFTVAATEGLVSVASVCSSLYPVVTIALAAASCTSASGPRRRPGSRS